MDGHGIVVGFDDSPSARAALEWGLRELAATGGSLRAVHTLPLVVDPVRLPLSASVLPSSGTLVPASRVDPTWRDRITAAFEEARPGAGASLEFALGEPGPVLVAQAQDARMLVVGTREHTGIHRLLVGSTSHYCLSHASCPVVAVPAVGARVASARARTGLTAP